MVRYCIVEDCKESDVSILAHRFPKKMDKRIMWQKTLNLEDYDLDLLFNKYVVCKNHFYPSDYRNPISKHLNVTATPHLQSQSRKGSSTTKIQPSKSTVEIVDITEDETNPDDSKPKSKPAEAQTIETIEYETVYAQRRRKRTTEEIGEEIVTLTQEAFKRMKPEPLPKSPSPVPIVQKKENVVELDYTKNNEEPPEDATTNVNLNSCEYTNVIEVTLAEVACQTDETEEKDDSEFGTLSRTELVKLLKEKDQTIETLQKKISKFEAAMSAFKVLMNPLD